MKRLIILAATLIAGLSACDSLLDKEPLDRVTQFDYFKTRSDLELFSNPFYDNLLDKTPYDEQNDLLVQMTLSDVLYGGDKRTVPNTGGGWSWGNLRRINSQITHICKLLKDILNHNTSDYANIWYSTPFAIQR